MKQINELRITNTINYIREYFATHGAYPTYRDIKEDCNYSSLSLVYSDINRLKQRGILVENNFKQIQLVEIKEKYNFRYDYPVLIMTNALYNLDRLNEEEKTLLDAQDNYFKGEYELAKRACISLLNNSKDQSVIFGARLTLCWVAIYTGEVEYWREYFRIMISYNSKSVSEKMEKELMAHFLTSILGNNDNCPTWLKEGRFNDLRKEALPLASILYISNTIKDNPSISPYLLEPICSTVFYKKQDLSQVYMDLYLAMIYHYNENDKYLKEHLENAITICLKRNWLTPLAEMKRNLAAVLYPLIEKYDGLIKKIDELNSKLSFGFNKIYDALVGENPVKDLTFREVEIINYTRLGLSNQEIADKLYLSSETIKYYLSSIYLKLGVSGRKELKEFIKKQLMPKY